MILRQEMRESYIPTQNRTAIKDRQHPSRALELWQPRNRKINDNFLPEDMKYKTVADRLDPVLGNISSKERKSKNVHSLINHPSKVMLMVGLLLNRVKQK